MHIVLYQFRSCPFTKAAEYESLLRSGKLREDQLLAVDVMNQVPNSDQIRGARAIIIGGSPLSVFEPVPHLVEMRECLKLARLSGRAILGICFGAQLLAHLYGGHVVRDDPANHEFGTYRIRLHRSGQKDALFSGLGDSFDVQCSHQDRIIAPPIGSTMLASNELAQVQSSSDPFRIQAFGISGFNIYGVQFHPERNKADCLARLAHKRLGPEHDAADLDAQAARLRDTPEAERVVANFVDHYVRPCLTIQA